METNSRFIVEGLRSGVPYREMAKTIAFGRERNIAAVHRLMEQIEQEHPPKFPGYVLRAGYGEGKTHLLHSLWGFAESRNWVVSCVSVSKETPLDRLDQLYPKLIENTYLPGSSQPGIAHIVAQALEGQLLAEARTMDFSPRVMALLDCLVIREEGYDELIADLSGEFLGSAELKRMYRANVGKILQLTRTSLREEAFEYMRLVDWLIHKAGFGGWLILVDEVELIGKLGRGARSHAYANMGRMLSGSLPYALSVWALASHYHGDVLIGRHDREECPAWLASRQKEAFQVPWAETALEALTESKLLEPLSVEDIQSLLKQIVDLHQTAYQWQAPFTANELYAQVRQFAPTQDTRLRTIVRLSLTILDIWDQYGEAPVIEYMNPLEEQSIEEEPEASG
ncbi:MAG: DUF2791 family P-loop domain-containing protein [Firmicutes bacterium]|nr:DUF2791 family P-loop domain-containing protein [Bacillota bacterium]